MANRKPGHVGSFGLTEREFAAKFGITYLALRKQISRGRVDIDHEQSVVLFAIYISQGELRDRFGRVLSAWKDWADGKLVAPPDTSSPNELATAAMLAIWSNEHHAAFLRYRKAYDKDISALAVTSGLRERMEHDKSVKSAESERVRTLKAQASRSL